MSCACPLDLVLISSRRAAALSLREGGFVSSLPLRVGGGAGASLFAFLGILPSLLPFLERLGSAVRAVGTRDLRSTTRAATPLTRCLRLLFVQNYGVLLHEEASFGSGETSP